MRLYKEFGDVDQSLFNVVLSSTLTLLLYIVVATQLRHPPTQQPCALEASSPPLSLSSSVLISQPSTHMSLDSVSNVVSLDTPPAYLPSCVVSCGSDGFAPMLMSLTSLLH